MTQPAQGLAYIVQVAEERLEGYCDLLDCCGWRTGDVREFVRELIADTEGPVMEAITGRPKVASCDG